MIAMTRNEYAKLLGVSVSTVKKNRAHHQNRWLATVSHPDHKTGSKRTFYTAPTKGEPAPFEAVARSIVARGYTIHRLRDPRGNNFSRARIEAVLRGSEANEAPVLLDKAQYAAALGIPEGSVYTTKNKNYLARKWMIYPVKGGRRARFIHPDHSTNISPERVRQLFERQHGEVSSVMAPDGTRYPPEHNIAQPAPAAGAFKMLTRQGYSKAAGVSEDSARRSTVHTRMCWYANVGSSTGARGRRCFYPHPGGRTDLSHQEVYNALTGDGHTVYSLTSPDGETMTRSCLSAEATTTQEIKDMATTDNTITTTETRTIGDITSDMLSLLTEVSKINQMHPDRRSELEDSINKAGHNPTDALITMADGVERAYQEGLTVPDLLGIVYTLCAH